jgi:phospholipase/carboxylesterase
MHAWVPPLYLPADPERKPYLISPYAMPAVKPNFPHPLIFSPLQSDPQQLFVLLHGESANPEQLLPLAQAIKHAFPLALVVLPCGPIGDDALTYQWFDQPPAGVGYAPGVAQALPGLIALVRQIQARYGLSGEQTALAGFSQGATLALEACAEQAGLAGRVLAFSGSYARLPTAAPAATTLHFFHGAEDEHVPVDQIREAHARLAELDGDATLDIASAIGHEMHPALVGQAIHRLQTCVPLRSWQAAMGELAARADDQTAEDLPGSVPKNRTLH